MVDRLWCAEETPLRGRRRHIRVLDQRHVVVGHLPSVIAAVEAHRRHRPHISPRPQGADLLQSDNFRPESVRLLDVSNVQHDVIDANRSSGIVRAILCHRNPPR
jgi:hypothetical protein